MLYEHRTQFKASVLGQCEQEVLLPIRLGVFRSSESLNPSRHWYDDMHNYYMYADDVISHTCQGSE